MHQHNLIDAKTASKMKMTPEEAQAVIEMWAVHQRLADPGRDMPSVQDLSEGLTIAPSEVRNYLNQVRAMRKRGVRTPRPKSADVRLAMMAAGGFLVVVACVASFVNFNKRRQYYPPPYASYAPAYEMTTTVAPAPSRGINGMSQTTVRSGSVSARLASMTAHTARAGFSIDRTIYLANGSQGATYSVDDFVNALQRVSGGAMADHSVLPSRRLTNSEIAQALQSAPSTDLIPVAFENSEAQIPPPGVGGNWIQWKSLQIGYGGKVTRANIPFARVSDPALVAQVEREQSRIIGELAEAGKRLQGSPTPGTPAP